MIKALNKITLFWKIILPILSIVFLGTAVSFNILSGADTSKKFFENFYKDNVLFNQHLNDIDKLFTKYHVLLLAHLSAEGAPEMGALGKDVKDIQANIENILTIHNQMHGESHVQIQQDLFKASRSFNKQVKLVLELSIDFEKEQAYTQLNTHVTPLLLQINALVHEEMKRGNAAMELFFKDAVSIQLHNTALAWIFVFISVFFSGLVAYILARYLSGNITSIAAYAVELGKGNFNAKLTIHSEDEFGELSTSLNAMGGDLARAFEDLKSANEQLKREAEKKEYLALELSKSREFYRDIIEGTDDLITQVDHEGRFTFVNHMSEQVFGMKPEDCIGLFAFDFIHQEDQQNTMESFGRWVGNKTEHATFENRQVSRTGTVRHFLWTINLHYDQSGQAVNVNSIANDITLRKQTEIALEQAKTRAEDANMAKSQFLANMSHEIRTPMNAIIGMTNLALETELSAEQDKYLQTVKESGDALLYLLNDLLDFSKIEAGEVALENHSFNLKELLESVVSTFAFTAQEKCIDLSFNLPGNIEEHLIGDSHRIRQVLTNLISIALKFTWEGTIGINVEVLEAQESTVRLQFSIADTGIGVSGESCEQIFERFKQADNNTTRIHGGPGLGLAICKHIVELFNGKIWIENSEGGGSIFYFTVCMQSGTGPIPNEQGTPLNTVVSLQSIEAMNVLVVEDNAFNQDLIRFILEKNGHAVTLTSSGFEALETLVHKSFDVVFMDVQMPQMDGLTTTQYIRAAEKGVEFEGSLPSETAAKLVEKIQHTNIPIIAMTAHAMSGDRERCIKSGMDDYLTKPLQPRELAAVMSVITVDRTERSAPKKKEDTSAKNESEPVLLSPVDLAKIRKYLSETYNIQPEAIDPMLQTLGKSLQGELTRAKIALQSGDLTALSTAAHTIKGALRNAGQNFWADIAFRIEKQKVRNDVDLIDELGVLLNKLEAGVSPLIP